MTSATPDLNSLVAEERWTDVIAVLDRDWAVLLSADPSGVLEAVNRLPQDVVDAHPRWHTAREYVGRLVQRSSPRTSRYRGAGTPAKPRGLLDALAELTARAASARVDARYDEATAAVAEARGIFDEASHAARQGLRQAMPELHYQWAMVWEFAGDTDAAAAEYTESYDAAVLVGNHMTQVRSSGALAWTHALAGRTAIARTALLRVLDDGKEWWRGASSVPGRMAIVLLLCDELRFDEANIHLGEIRIEGDPERWPFLALLKAMLRRDPANALVLLTQIDSSMVTAPARLESSGAGGAAIAIARFLLHTAAGHLGQASRVLAIPKVRADGVVGQLLTTARAIERSRAGHHRDAARLVAPFRATSTSTPRVVIGALVLCAANDAHNGDAPAARANFTAATRLASETGAYLPLAFIDRSDLAALLERSWDGLPGDVATALRRFSAPGQKDPFVRLTTRERAVLRTVLETETVAEAARSLHVSPNTVKTQLASIRRKTGTRTRDELERLALAHGHLIDRPT